MEIVHATWIFNDVIGKIIGLAIKASGVDTTAGHPHRVAPRMMITTVNRLAHTALRVNSPTKLAAPNDHR